MSEYPMVVPVSCYIRTQNEERRIRDVILAAKTVASEIVIVDSGSTDRTVEIATEEGARIIKQSWLGNGNQKLVGEAACKFDWVLDLDADEVLSPELQQEIRELFTNGQPQQTVYYLSLTTVDPSGHIWYRAGVSLRAKLYNREYHSMPAHGAWDQLQLERNVERGKLNSALLHYAFTGIGHLTEKQNSAMTKRVRSLDAPHIFLLVSRIYVAFPFYFVKKFILQGLWKAGIFGFSVSVTCAYSRWARDVKLYEKRSLCRSAKETQQPSDDKIAA
jgi:glycosyltransferase involved in cell wall biosynthesis